jgi:probable F420-dependent oxidoreductase
MAPAPGPRPFRFGVQANGTADRAGWVELARRIESLGYDVLTMPDHFSDQLGVVPALMAAADATERLRVGALVFSNDYKHPVVLAKELATLDVLSDGRLEVGLGTGWMISDYEQAGIAYDRPGVRIERFVEAVDVLNRAFGDGPFDLAGKHYTITGYNGFPKPVQKPRPPLLIGAGGKRMLGIAARVADIVGVNGTLTTGAVTPEMLATMTGAAVTEKVGWVREAAGDRLANIELNIRTFFVKVTDDRLHAADQVGGFVGWPGEEVLQSPFAIIGTTKQIADDLRERRDRLGFSYIVVGQGDIDDVAPVVAELAGT